MSLPANDPELAKAAWEHGADAVKVHINVEHRASNTIFRSFEEEYEALKEILSVAKGPTGIVLGGDVLSAAKDYESVVKAGFDFVSLYVHHTPMQVLQSDKILKMLAIDYTYSQYEINSLSHIGADILEASVIKPETYGQPLTAREIISYKYIVQNTDIPVVVPTQRDIKASHLSTLAQCGVNGVMLGAIVTGKTKESISRAIAEFRNYIDRM